MDNSEESRGELTEDSEMGDLAVGRGQNDELVNHLRFGAFSRLLELVVDTALGDCVLSSIDCLGEVREYFDGEDEMRDEVTSTRMPI